ncbi:serine/threonine-protein kinase [Frigoribacterium sp. VKM Ac-2836]|uniref:serine/threonine-protein kinase n=1 Tax=Frigoribacterium sp. VKM Ac-2836 TaxID=2739014 RepID=UPI001562FBE1|nr:serine/threonine-protein kinase [Frigoribacterium sp. VKM Ac-2836]NRD25927.1 protein kinase [Frigoribacterium sp. VKM Ac-2836]
MSPREQADPRLGTTVGDRYRLDAIVGRGGMGAVYRAKDLELGRDVAVKLFSSDGHDVHDLSRQVSEVRLLASLNHPGLVTLYDARVEGDGHDDDAYLVMEYVDGPTLQTVLADGPLTHAEAAALLGDVADGLAAVHRAGVVHRDVKPANILLAAPHHEGDPRRAKLADFGIAYLIDSTRVTATGTLMGTAAFVSPEQAEGRPPAPASDVYSLGLVLVEALTGRRVFTGSVVESVMARLTRDPEIPASIGAGWAELLTRMTSRAPEDRPGAAEVARAARTLANEGAGSTAAVTRVMAAPDVATAALPGGDAPTRVLPRDDARTQVLGAGAASGTDATGLAADVDPEDRGRKRRRWPLVLAAVVVAGLLAAGIGWAATRDGDVVDPTPSSSPSVETGPSTTPSESTVDESPSPSEDSTDESPADPTPSDEVSPTQEAPVEPTTQPTVDPVTPPTVEVPGAGTPGGNSGPGNNGNGNNGNGKGQGKGVGLGAGTGKP